MPGIERGRGAPLGYLENRNAITAGAHSPGNGVKSRHVTIGLTLLVAIVAAVAVYWTELERIRLSTMQTFDVRSNLIRQYIRQMRQNVYALEHAIESRYAHAQHDGSIAPEIGAIRHYPEHGVWGLSGLASEGGIAALSGTLTGFDALHDPSFEVQKELSAVFESDHQFRTLVDNVPQIIWVYYTSTNDWVYVAPDPAIADFRYSEVVKTKEFWAHAVPENNPELRQIVTNLYDDYYGQGLMISISSPVVIDDRFVGVASIDLGIDLLRRLTGIGRAAGESILVDEDDRIVARVRDFRMTEEYDIPPEAGWIDHADAYWLSGNIVAGEMRLLHRLPKAELYRDAAGASMLLWILLATMLGLVVFSLRLNEALSQVRSLMSRDTLTDLLNRRGFSAAAGSLRKTATDRVIGLLLLDIDYFKEINDTCGHEFGDQVLVGLARRLRAGLTEHDLVCRWGGDEILACVICDHDASLSRIAERLRMQVAERPILEQGMHITISGGMTVWAADETLDGAVNRADKLLYRAKAAGRNRIESDVDDSASN